MRSTAAVNEPTAFDVFREILTYCLPGWRAVDVVWPESNPRDSARKYTANPLAVNGFMTLGPTVGSRGILKETPNR